MIGIKPQPNQVPPLEPMDTSEPPIIPPKNQEDCEVLAKFKCGEWTSFHLAAYQDWPEEAIMTLDVSLLNVTDDSNGETPLHVAARKDHYRFIKAVNKFYELEISAMDEKGYTPLHVAAQRGNEQSLAQLLYNNKVKLDYGGFDTPCPIHLAVSNDHIGCVRMLLQAGCNVNAVFGAKSKTALHLAAKKGRDDVCRLLLSYSGDLKKPKPLCKVNATDSLGRTAFHYAATGNHSDVVDVLCNYNGRINARDQDGKTAMHVAAMNGFKKFTQTLVSYKADKDAVDKWDMKAVEYAFDNGFDALAGIILDA